MLQLLGEATLHGSRADEEHARQQRPTEARVDERHGPQDGVGEVGQRRNGSALEEGEAVVHGVHGGALAACAVDHQRRLVVVVERLERRGCHVQRQHAVLVEQGLGRVLAIGSGHARRLTEQHRHLRGVHLELLEGGCELRSPRRAVGEADPGHRDVGPFALVIAAAPRARAGVYDHDGLHGGTEALHARPPVCNQQQPWGEL